MKEKDYIRQNVIEYAKKWAYLRNPNYYNFDFVGGDCTNFVSQCIYQGSKVMNYEKNGWYYKNGNNKSASWTGVEYLYKFLINNKGIGPYAENSTIEYIEKGDVIQLSFDGNIYAHTLLVIQTDNNPNLKNTLIASHTFDAYEKSISLYNFKKIRYIHIKGVRK